MRPIRLTLMRPTVVRGLVGWRGPALDQRLHAALGEPDGGDPGPGEQRPPGGDEHRQREREDGDVQQRAPRAARAVRRLS